MPTSASADPMPSRIWQLRFSAAYVHPPVPGCRRKYLPFVGEDTIVVYPESVFGNFLHAKKTVRWLLNVNPFPENTSEAYGENALFIAYRSVFNDPKLNPAGHTVEISYFDLDTYRQYNFGQRKGNCYIVRKGGNRPDLPKELDGIVIDRLSEEDIVRVFNESEYCISYDPQTSYASIAALCGCTSVVIPEPGKGRGDYLSAEDDSSGIAFGFSEEEISYAKQTRYKVRELFEDSNRQGMAEAQRFAELCEVYFAEKEMC